MINEHLHKWEEAKRAKQKETVYTNKKLPHKQWEQPELPFNNHKKGATGYEPEYNHNKTIKKKPTKPDPATVEAELQLEEQLWQS